MGWRCCAWHAQGRILHNALEEDAVPELLQAHRMSPWRAEPLVYLAWQYARRMQARPPAALLACQPRCAGAPSRGRPRHDMPLCGHLWRDPPARPDAPTKVCCRSGAHASQLMWHDRAQDQRL